MLLNTFFELCTLQEYHRDCFVLNEIDLNYLKITCWLQMLYKPSIFKKVDIFIDIIL